VEHANIKVLPVIFYIVARNYRT